MMKENTTPKNIIRGLAVILEVLCFMPMFLVSCYGEDVEVSAKTALCGYEDIGIDPSLLSLFAFVVPIVLFAAWFLKGKVKENVIKIVVLGLTMGDICFWVSFKNKVVEIAEKNYCDFETTSAYTINLVLLGIVGLLVIADLFKLLLLDQSLFALSGNEMGQRAQEIQNNIKGATSTASSTVKIATSAAMEAIREQSQNKEENGVSRTVRREEAVQETKNIQVETIKYEGFCSQCGNKMKIGTKFCVHCGAQKE